MTFALVYWILMLLWLVFGLYRDRENWPILGGNLLMFILLLLLGWRVFGAPLHG